MKQFFYTALVFAGILSLSSCSNGDYVANPSGNANDAVNPLVPLTSSEFTWEKQGSQPISADINGSKWVAENYTFTVDSSDGNNIIGTKGASRIQFYLKDVWKDNVYEMEWEDYDRYCQYSDSAGSDTYTSYLSNSGGIKMLQHDSATISGLFYFKGVALSGKVINVKNGYFKVVRTW